MGDSTYPSRSSCLHVTKLKTQGEWIHNTEVTQWYFQAGICDPSLCQLSCRQLDALPPLSQHLACWQSSASVQQSSTKPISLHINTENQTTGLLQEKLLNYNLEQHKDNFRLGIRNNLIQWHSICKGWIELAVLAVWWVEIFVQVVFSSRKASLCNSFLMIQASEKMLASSLKCSHNISSKGLATQAFLWCYCSQIRTSA